MFIFIDDKLTLEEFKEGSKNDPRIVQALSLEPDPNVGLPAAAVSSWSTYAKNNSSNQQNVMNPLWWTW